MSSNPNSPILRPSTLSPTSHLRTDTPARNPVSQRLYRALGSSFDDPTARDALITLSSFYASASVDSSKSKPAQEEDDDWDADEFSEEAGKLAVGSISDRLPGEVAAKARKNMRRDVEQRLAESSRQFLEAFGTVNEVRPCFPGCGCLSDRMVAAT
jgi:conserved oligomeric Golgi complex subunit 6